jgi:hypothetical protein
VFLRVGVVVVTFGVMAGIGTLLRSLDVGAVGRRPFYDTCSGSPRGSVLTLVGSWLAAVLLGTAALTRPLKGAPAPACVVGRHPGALSRSRGRGVVALRRAAALDGFARGAPLGHAIGRIGCLTYGCCFGRETHGRLAITYTHPQSKAVRVGLLNGVRLHPAPLYEAVLHLVLFSVLNAAALLGAPRGLPAALCLLGYGLGRFVIEFSRDNGPHAAALPGGEPGDLARLAAAGVAAVLPILAFAPAAPPIAWTAVREAAVPLSVAVTAASVLIGAGFALQRGRVGSW